MAQNPITNELVELTIERYHELLRHRKTTCEEVVTHYLTRISQYNPTLKALITINPNALHTAREKDIEIQTTLENASTSNYQGRHVSPLGTLPPLHGVPLVLKDTYSTYDMPTTAGVRALRSLETYNDAFVVRKLREAGAIILAKANLHELSLQGITVSSLGGQTLNPYDLTRTPGGSSGGTAAALAADLCLGGCGGDTMNSLRSPASACAVVGFRPTKGQVSRSGIIGVSETQDAVGPMARTVGDVRVLFEVMRGEDSEGDSSTINPARQQRQSPPVLEPRTVRVGILDGYFGSDPGLPFEEYKAILSGADEEKWASEEQLVTSTIMHALQRLQTSTTSSSSPSASKFTLELIHIPSHTTEDWTISTLLDQADTQSFEFLTTLNAFLQSPNIKPTSTPHHTLQSIIASNDYHHTAVPRSVFYEPLQNPTKHNPSPMNKDYQARLTTIAHLKESVTKCFDDFDGGGGLDFMVYPHQRQLVVKHGETVMVQPGRNGILAALTGRPAVCLPGGFSPPSISAPKGIPIGIEFMGKPWRDDDLLSFAEWVESILSVRQAPDMDGLQSSGVPLL